MKKERQKKSIVPKLIAGLTATAVGFATYTLFRGGRPLKHIEQYGSKKKQERMFL
ncbi:hypothetical protein [Reichenbachiella sp. 5M10]|uniref:hypothetical protein n=1 Tax=Reichenbachiella sp. 5M10 TaxID=1889772 RepID=UPI001303FBF0|nr:hypothetical protein [Reichenbachiella sp. 5M10]